MDRDVPVQGSPRLEGSKSLIRPGAKLDGRYYGFALPVIQKQLAKAGIRIAFILNEIFR
jgi:hypothetical protein